MKFLHFSKAALLLILAAAACFWTSCEKETPPPTLETEQQIPSAESAETDTAAESAETEVPETEPAVEYTYPLYFPLAEEDYNKLNKAAKAAHFYIQKRIAPLNYSSYQLADPTDNYNFNGVKNVRLITPLTGEYSINKMRSNYFSGSVDIGTMINTKNSDGEDVIFFAFGDTFRENDITLLWRSNTVAYTTDTDYTDGILFDGMLTEDDNWMAREVIPSKKVPYDEHTVIPSGGIAIGDNMYITYMSINNWDGQEQGNWQCNYGGMVRSTNGGMTWTKMVNLQWPGDTHFCQMTPYDGGDGYIYILGITGGRNSYARLMRVKTEDFEKFSAYEYLVGREEDGTPIYQKGEEGLYSDYAAIDGTVGEMSVMYSEYLNEWLVTYESNALACDLVMRAAKAPDGEWSNPVSIVKCSDINGIYGAFMNPLYVSEGGKKICFLMSVWSPVHNICVMEMELVKDDE